MMTKYSNSTDMVVSSGEEQRAKIGIVDEWKEVAYYRDGDGTHFYQSTRSMLLRWRRERGVSYVMN